MHERAPATELSTTAARSAGRRSMAEWPVHPHSSSKQAKAARKHKSRQRASKKGRYLQNQVDGQIDWLPYYD